MFAASFRLLEEVQTDEIFICGHPIWIVCSIDTRSCIDFGVIGMIVPDGHVFKIVFVAFVGRPRVIQLLSVLVGAVSQCWKELFAARFSRPEEVNLFVPINTIPCGIVPSKATVVGAKIREIIVLHGVGTAHPCFILGFRVYSIARCDRAI